MNTEEQEAICKAIAISCMWGQGGIGSVILERLDKVLPQDGEGFYAMERRIAKQTIREHVGIITDDEVLSRYLNPFSNPNAYSQAGMYSLTNFDEDGCSLFYPPPSGGLCKYVSKELADKYRSRYDYQTTRTYSPAVGG